MRVLLLLFLTLALLAAVASAGAETGPSPQIFSARLDGSDEQSLSGEAQPAMSPTPARDGRIAFVRRVGDRVTFWVMNADGSGQREFAPAPEEPGTPAWSPTGTAIAYSRWNHSQCGPDSLKCGRGEIVVVDPATRALRSVVGSRYFGAGSFSWAPDGSRLAYAGELNVDREAHTVETIRGDGTGRRVVLRLPPSASVGYDEVAWSPRGDRIAYVRGGWIWLVRPQGGASTKLVRGATPVWSPRGDKLLFLSGRSVSVVDLATRRTRMLGRGPWLLLSPSPWSPDGRRVAFEVRTPGVSNISVVRVSDGRLLHSWRPGGTATPPVFTRDGSRLVYSRSAS